MKTASFAILLCGVVLCHSVTQEEIPTRFRRLDNDKIIKSRKNDFGEKVGIPLVFNVAKKSFMETKVSGTHAATKGVKQEQADHESSKTMMEEELTLDKSPPAVAKLNEDSKDVDNEERQENNGTNKEEMGGEYDDIGDMGSEKGEKQKSQHNKVASTSSKEDEMTGEKEILQSSGEIPDLNGDFPPTADQVIKLPKDLEITQEEVDRKMLDKHKGYFQFTIGQRFKPEFKYRESSAYKILAGNVIYDVERALKASRVVKDVLFREAKNVGGPPYRSKVQVYLKTIKVDPKKMKKIINYGLINGMVTVPGSFHAT